MLMLTQLAGFASGSGGGTDVTPDPFSFNDISDSARTAVAWTNAVTITGIDTTITLRLAPSPSTGGSNSVTAYRNGVYVGFSASGQPLDVAITNGQTLQFAFYNASSVVSE